MKQHDIHNDDALYQQMLAELAPGAEEYDKLIAEGKHPAAKVRHSIPYYKYIAAACVLVAVVGGTWFWQIRNEAEPQTQLVAQFEEEEPVTEYYKVQVQKETETEETTTTLEPQKQVRHSRQHTSNTLTVAQTEQLAEDSTNTPADTPNQELYYALLAEVEAREIEIKQQEQQAMRALIDELIYNIEQQPNRPELSL